MLMCASISRGRWFTSNTRCRHERRPYSTRSAAGSASEASPGRIMNEAQWQSCTDPTAMLGFLSSSGKASRRKLRLFAVASFRRLIALLPDPRQRQGIEVLEQLAEGAVTRAACRGVTAEVRRAIPQDD